MRPEIYILSTSYHYRLGGLQREINKLYGCAQRTEPTEMERGMGWWVERLFNWIWLDISKPA